MTLRKKRILKIERGSTRSHSVENWLWKRLHSVENWLWKRLWTCRETDYRMNDE